MNELFLNIVNMSITASILVLLVLVLRLLLKKAPKWVNVLLWGLVAIRLVCPFGIESPLSLIPKTEWIVQESVEEEELFLNSVPDSIPAMDFSSLGEDITFHYYPLEPHIEINRGVNSVFVLNCIWLAGVAAMLVYMIVSYICVYRRIHDAKQFRDNIYTSESVSSPFVFGLIRPRICLPENMDAVSMSYVIAHEEAHLRRFDHLWKPFGFILLAVHWFNPLIWLAYILLCRDIEMACDEKVVRDMNEAERADYSEALLECSVSRKMITACPLAFGEVGAKQRIKSVLNYKKPAFWIVVVAVVACIAAAVCFLTNPEKIVNTSVTGLRFPCDDPTSPETCTVEINGKIQYDEFRGDIVVDGRKIETSFDMTRDTPPISYYNGSRLETYGLFYILNDTFSEFAFKISESNEYVICGMSVDEFENIMAKKNYYVDYMHDVVLHDITVSDKAQIISDIHTEGRTVIIYGKDLDTEEINRTFYSGDNVMGTTEYLPSKNMRVFYACASTCLNGTVYIGYYSVNFPADANKADVMAQLDDEYFTETTLFGIGYDFRNKILEMHAAETDSISIVIKTDPLPEEKIPLTLEDVITLSAKGTALTWEDFAEFNYIETGSGLYIRVYEIDETFELWIGGGSPTPIGNPMYIRLKCKDCDVYADVTKDDVAAFVTEHQNFLFGTPLTWFYDTAWEKAQQTAEEQGLDLDKNTKTIFYSENGEYVGVEFYDKDGLRHVRIAFFRDENGNYTTEPQTTQKAPVEFTAVIKEFDTAAFENGMMSLNIVEFITHDDTERIAELNLDEQDMIGGYYIHDEDESITTLNLPEDTEFIFFDWWDAYTDETDERYEILGERWISTRDAELFYEYWLPYKDAGAPGYPFVFTASEESVVIKEIPLM